MENCHSKYAVNLRQLSAIIFPEPEGRETVCCNVLLFCYDGVVQRLAFKGIQGWAAQPEPFCPSVELDGTGPEQSPGMFLWVLWQAPGTRQGHVTCLC